MEPGDTIVKTIYTGFDTSISLNGTVIAVTEDPPAIQIGWEDSTESVIAPTETVDG